MSGSRGYKRRVYVVKKTLQYRFVAWVVCVVLVAAGVVLLDAFISMHRHAIQTGLTVQVTDLYDPADPFTILKVVIYVAGVFYASVLLSHRVAGPLYRFEKSAEEVAAGNLTHKVFLRDRDELVEFRDAFNSMVDSLRGRVAGDVACAFRGKKQLEALLEKGDLPEEAVERVKRAISEMDRVGKEFRI
jgi:methyl-accepting chemotaxis protein